MKRHACGLRAAGGGVLQLELIESCRTMLLRELGLDSKGKIMNRIEHEDVPEYSSGVLT